MMERFGPRGEHMPDLIIALGDTNPGELVETALADRFAALGARTVTRVEEADPRKALSALRDCMSVEGPAIAVTIRWSLADELRQLQLNASLARYPDRRAFRRERSDRVIGFSATSAAMEVRQKTKADAEWGLALELERFEAVTSDDPRKAAAHYREHRANVERVSQQSWPREDLLRFTKEVWISGMPSQLKLQAEGVAARAAALFDDWRSGKTPVEVTPVFISAPVWTPGIYDQLGPPQGEAPAPAVVMSEAAMFQSVRYPGTANWISAPQGMTPDFRLIEAVMRDPSWQRRVRAMTE